MNSATTLPTGQLMQTIGINEASQDTYFAMWCFAQLRRHMALDFGDCDKEDAERNQYAASHGERIFSVYNIPEGLRDRESKIWIITEADRSSTCILFPNEY